MVYKNGGLIAELAGVLNSFLDIGAIPGGSYAYSITAVDVEGNVSGECAPVHATACKGDIKPGNIAPYASILASSQFSDGYPATAVADGFTGVTGEWVSSGESTPWIRLTWDEERIISKIVLYGRDTDANSVKNGILRFSDGSSAAVGALGDDGAGVEVEFCEKAVTWVEFRVTRAKGYNIGLSEIEVFGR